MSKQNEADFQSATECWICDKDFENDKVRDHCHITGQYRGAAHNKCKLKLAIKPYKTPIPVIFHNLINYDSYLIMQKIAQMKGSFSLGQLKFLNSFQFMSSSLENLVKATKQDDFNITKKEFADKTDIILRKGGYPYEYMDSWERFEETELPPIEKLYSILSDESITSDDYVHAQKVWKTFNCNRLGDYHDLCLKTDITLLADVFQTFRKTCMNTYKLDPPRYYTSPGLSWDALLKYTKINLELLTDYDMHLFIEKGLRGGISMISKRHAKANNPKLSDYNPEKDKNYIMYYDANNLYGWAMSQSLPMGGFKWVSEDIPYLDVPTDSETGYILEVDLEYPKELHVLHNEYPLATERLKIEPSWMSDYQKNVQKENKTVSVEKLVPNLMDKNK